jgi:transcriptional regulator with XRE-family HTH domain
MSKYQQVWQSLQDKEYREEYSSDVGTGLAFQIRLLRERNGWTQERLAQLTDKRQETISQWENPNYGSYTLNSLKSLAVAFDIALLVKFVPFSELVEWNASLTPERLAPPSFTEENATRRVTSRPSPKLVMAVAAAEPFYGFGTAVASVFTSLTPTPSEGTAQSAPDTSRKEESYARAA